MLLCDRSSVLIDSKGYRGAKVLVDLNPLAFKKIKLSVSSKDKETSPETKDTLPTSAREAGQYLLDMLRTEYECRKESIAGLEPSVALFALKDQYAKYLQGSYPFNQAIRSTDGPQEWWVRLHSNDDATPLAVCGYPSRVSYLHLLNT